MTAWTSGPPLPLPATLAAVAALVSAAGLAHAWRASRRSIPQPVALRSWAWVLGPCLLTLAACLVRREFDLAALSPVAVWGFLGCLVVGAWTALAGIIQAAREPAVSRPRTTEAWIALVLAFGLMSVLLPGQVPAGDRMADWRPPGGVRTASGSVQFPEFNFQLEKPSKDWTPLDPSKFAPVAKVVWVNSSRPIQFLVIPEALDEMELRSVDQFVELSKSNLGSAPDEVKFLRELTETIGGVEGRRFEAELRPGGDRVLSIHWNALHQGFAYQLIVQGPAEEAELVRAQATQMFTAFSLVDPRRSAPGTGAARTLDAFGSPHFGFSVRLEKGKWHAWPGVAAAWPSAEFGAMGDQRSTFVVLPFRLPSPRPSTDAVSQALLARAGMQALEPTFTARRPITIGAFRGETFTARRSDLSGEWECRVRVLQSESTAYLLTAAAPAGTSGGAARLDEVLDQVTLTDRPPADAAALPENLRRSQALFLNELALGHFKRERYPPAAELFRSARAAWPENPTLLENEGDALARSGRPADALAQLDLAAAMVATNVPLQGLRARLLWQSDRKPEASDAFAKAFEAGLRNDDSLSTYVGHLFSSGRADEARKRLSAYATRHDSRPVRLLQADLLRKNGDAAGALKILGSQRGKEGAGADVAVIATETLLSLGKPEVALKTAREVLDTGSESAALWVLRARAELALNHPSDAKRSFENAARIDPASPEIKLWLTRVSGLLGQGENSSVKKPITPVDIPGALRKDWPSPRLAAEVAEYGAQYLERVLAIRYERGKELRTTEQWKVEVINAAGVARFRNLEFEFDPLGEEVFLNSVVVRDAAGKVVATSHADDWFVTDDAVQVGQGVASSRKMLQAPVPGLQPGHVLEVVFTRKALGAPKEFRWSSETFSRLTPTVRSMVYLEGDVAEVRAEHSDGVRALDGKGFRAWISDQPALWHSEPMQPMGDVFRPMLWLSDARTTWGDLAADYLGSIRDKRFADAEVKSAFAEAGSGPSSEDIVLRLAHAVQQRCAYQSIAFGRRARMPSAPGDTLRKRYGDCKDQSVLLVELLKLAGIEAHLALANIGANLRTNLPSLDQFSHMIVHVPGKDGGRFLDTTSRQVDPLLAPVVSLGGRSVFVLDPAAPRFVEVPAPTAGSSRVKVDRQLTVADGTDLIVREDVEAIGSAAIWFRVNLTAVSPAEQRTRVQRLLATVAPSLELTELAVEGLEDVASPVKMRLVARLPRGLAVAGDRLVGVLPAAWEQLWFGPSPAVARHTPFEVRQPLLVESTVRFSLPSGYVWNDAPRLGAKAVSDFLSATLVTTDADGATAFTTRAERFTGLFPASRAAEERQATVDVSRLLAPALVLERVTPK